MKNHNTNIKHTNKHKHKHGKTHQCTPNKHINKTNNDIKSVKTKIDVPISKNNIFAGNIVIKLLPITIMINKIVKYFQNVFIEITASFIPSRNA